MAAKVFLALCGFAFTIQSAFGQCLGSRNAVVESNVLVNNAGLAGLGLGAAGLGLGVAGVPSIGLGLNNGLGLGLASPAYIDLSVLSAGGVLPISSVSPLVPVGLNVVSDNAIEGALLVSGQLPFLSAVALEGALASAGSGAASCGCGNGNIGIIGESGPAALLSGVNGLGLGGLNRCGCL